MALWAKWRLPSVRCTGTAADWGMGHASSCCCCCRRLCNQVRPIHLVGCGQSQQLQQVHLLAMPAGCVAAPRPSLAAA
jgi:hypothetical protein